QPQSSTNCSDYLLSLIQIQQGRTKRSCLLLRDCLLQQYGLQQIATIEPLRLYASTPPIVRPKIQPNKQKD
ncbi:MAG: hypothetical protein ACRDB8_07110, partial [Aeromonas veronii]